MECFRFVFLYFTPLGFWEQVILRRCSSFAASVAGRGDSRQTEFAWRWSDLKFITGVEFIGRPRKSDYKNRFILTGEHVTQQKRADP